MATLNSNPIIYSSPSGSSEDGSASLSADSLLASLAAPPDTLKREDWDSDEIFDLVRHVNDPEHPLTLEQLNVAQLTLIQVNDAKSIITLNFTPTIPHCFTEDAQILTNRGFLFCSEFESARDAGEQILVAAYEEKNDSFSFQPHTLIVKPAEERDMVQITDPVEDRRWSAEANRFGIIPKEEEDEEKEPKNDEENDQEEEEEDEEDEEEEDDEDEIRGHRTKRRRREKGAPRLRSSGLSLIVTRDHDLYVKVGVARNNSDSSPQFGKSVYQKMAASTLLDGVTKQVYNRSTRTHQAEVIQPSSRDVFKFRAVAGGGCAEASSVDFLSAFGLRADQKAPFLEVYGHWLGDGSLHVRIDGKGRTSVRFSAVKLHDIAWLEQKFAELGLVKNVTYFKDGPYGEASKYELEVIDQRWVMAFFTEYGGKYEHGWTVTACNPVTDPQPKSAKWFWSWVWRLSRDDARLVISGLRRADGSQAPQVFSDGFKDDGKLAIFTSSVRFRDELVRLLLHAGYSAMFNCMYAAGMSRGVLQGRGVVAAADNWIVRYAEEKSQYANPVMIRSRDIIQPIKHNGRVWCVSVPTGLIIARRAEVHGKVVTKASRPVIVGNCSMATLIGLSLRVKLLRSLPSRFKVEISITPGTHSSESAINKQLNDKERVAAALENSSLLEVVQKCIAHTDPKIDIQW